MIAVTEQIQKVAAQIQKVSKEYNFAIVSNEPLEVRLDYARKLLSLQKQLDSLMELMNEKNKQASND